MATFLFEETVFGPVKSRRLGVSLGINVLPNDAKVCNYDCIYCECGWNTDFRNHKIVLPTVEEVKTALDTRLKEMLANNEPIDAITFAGNGEPTLHPNFEEIVEVVYDLKEAHYPDAKIAILTNGTQIKRLNSSRIFPKVDQWILKLDVGNDHHFNLINKPVSNMQLKDLVTAFVNFDGEIVIQSLFLKGDYKGESVNNMGEKDIAVWLDFLKQINPKSVMIYSLDRDTPAPNLEKASTEELNAIAEKVKGIGLICNVYD